jgi:hypothetical protein
MPMVMNNSKTGTPNLKEVLPATREMKSSTDPISNMFSVVNVIGFYYLLNKVLQMNNHPVKRRKKIKIQKITDRNISEVKFCGEKFYLY